MNDKTVLPPTYLLVAIVLMLVLHFLLPVHKFVPVPWNILGVVPLACGIALNLIADRAFRQVQSTVKPFEQPTALITIGVFRITRNPMYLGHLIFMLGLAVTFWSWFALVLLAARAIWFHRRVLGDEQRLEARFGADYAAYRRQVKRWIPCIF